MQRPTNLARRSLSGAVLLIVAGLAATRSTMADELIVFVSPPDASDVASDVSNRLIPDLEALSSELGVEFTPVDVAEKGAPEDITITPLVVFQTERGRSIYSGRYATADRIRNFITTARMIPQRGTPTIRTNLPVWKQHGTIVGTPIKITPLNGDVPQNFDQDAFAESMHDAIASGMARFDLEKHASMTRSDRAFYIDFHPYRGGDTLYLAIEAYSQFNCHDPIFSQMSQPISGPWDERADVFARAAAVLEDQILARIGTPTHGDGFDFIARTGEQTTPTWEALGLERPEPDASATDRPTFDPAVLAQMREWIVDEAASKIAPHVVFHFPAPLDNYAGQVPDLTGFLTIDPNRIDADGAAAEFIADTTTITMGEPMLDETIRGSMILGTRQYQTSRFVLESLAPALTDQTSLEFGVQTPLVMTGPFTMRGITIPLNIRASLEPVIADSGAVRLILAAEWSIRLLEPFDIEGPDGPTPQNDTVLYRANIVLMPR